jgi:hypothetical protein
VLAIGLNLVGFELGFGIGVILISLHLSGIVPFLKLWFTILHTTGARKAEQCFQTKDCKLSGPGEQLGFKLDKSSNICQFIFCFRNSKINTSTFWDMST